MTGNAHETGFRRPKGSRIRMKTLEAMLKPISLMESMRTLGSTPKSAIANLINGLELSTKDPYL